MREFEKAAGDTEIPEIEMLLVAGKLERWVIFVLSVSWTILTGAGIK